MNLSLVGCQIHTLFMLRCRFSLRGERWWGVSAEWLSRAVLSLFFLAVSFPLWKVASVSEWQQWQHHLHQAGEASFFYPFSPTASHGSQPKLRTIVQCGAFLSVHPFEGKSKAQVPVHRKMIMWALEKNDWFLQARDEIFILSNSFQFLF